MRRLTSLSPLLVLTGLACVAPTPTPSLAELNARWVGQAWITYREVYGTPQQMAATPSGGQVAVYQRIRTEAGPRPSREVVNVATGERAILTSGANADVARQQWGPSAQTRVLDGSTSPFTYTCTTVIRVNAQGLIEKIERSGNDC